MSNFFILEDGPVASPSNCGICGYSGADRLFLDPRKDFEFYGSFIICEPCVGSMAEDFGFIQPVQARALEFRVEEAEREVEVLRAAIKQLESVHDLITQFNSERSDYGPGDLVSDDDAAYEGTVVEPVEPEGPDIVEEGPGDSEVDDDISFEGPDDVPDPIVLPRRFSEQSI